MHMKKTGDGHTLDAGTQNMKVAGIGFKLRGKLGPEEDFAIILDSS